MADHTAMKVNEDEPINTKEISDDRSQTVDVEHDTIKQTTVTQVPSRDWQMDCNLNECLLNVYTNKRWTDMSINCGEKDANNTLKAHKIILAARSPVFEAMLFGPCSDSGKVVYDFPAADVDIFDMMLRFMYNDDANLTNVDDATDLLQMANMYQIPKLVDHCAQYLQSNITEINVCKSLDYALKYSTPWQRSETLAVTLLTSTLKMLLKQTDS